MEKRIFNLKFININRDKGVDGLDENGKDIEFTSEEIDGIVKSFVGVDVYVNRENIRKIEFTAGPDSEKIDGIVKSFVGVDVYANRENVRKDVINERKAGKVIIAKLDEIKDGYVYVNCGCEMLEEGVFQPYISVMFGEDEEMIW